MLSAQFIIDYFNLDHLVKVVTVKLHTVKLLQAEQNNSEAPR